MTLSQQAPGPAHFPGFSTSQPRYAVPAPTLLNGLAEVAPAAPLAPTRWAAAAYAPLVTPTASPSAAESLAPRRDLTGAKAGPPYDLYQNLPEEFRKRTLSAPWTEPLPVQLLRGALGR